MKKDVDNIDIYNNSAIILEKRTPKKIISWITILIILLVMFIIFCFIPFNVYKPYYGILNVSKSDAYIDLNVSKSDAYIDLNVEYSDFPVNKYNKLYIKNKPYSYEIVNMQNNKLVLKIDLDNNLNIENNALLVNILEDRTTLKTIILKRIKKGFGL